MTDIKKPYIGLYEHSMDSKGRIMMPVELRERLGDRFYVTVGFDKCIFVFDEDTFAKMDDTFKNLSFNKKGERAFQRLFYSYAREVNCDKQGRVLLPQHLRKHANLNKDVVITGNSNRVEIWDLATREAYLDSLEMSYEDLAEEIEGE